MEKRKLFDVIKKYVFFPFSFAFFFSFIISIFKPSLIEAILFPILMFGIIFFLIVLVMGLSLDTSPFLRRLRDSLIGGTITFFATVILFSVFLIPFYFLSYFVFWLLSIPSPQIQIVSLFFTLYSFFILVIKIGGEEDE